MCLPHVLDCQLLFLRGSKMSSYPFFEHGLSTINNCYLTLAKWPLFLTRGPPLCLVVKEWIASICISVFSAYQPESFCIPSISESVSRKRNWISPVLHKRVPAHYIHLHNFNTGTFRSLDILVTRHLAYSLLCFPVPRAQSPKPSLWRLLFGSSLNYGGPLTSLLCVSGIHWSGWTQGRAWYLWRQGKLAPVPTLIIFLLMIKNRSHICYFIRTGLWIKVSLREKIILD